MTSEFNARSFDRPRERGAPSALRGHWSGGDETVLDLTDLTLVVAVKSNCDGCREFVNADLDGLHVPILVVSAADDEASEWRDARRPVFVSRDAFRLLDVRSAPFYVLVDPLNGRVVTEGVLFGPSQVAAEIAPFL
ncbi:MAG: hypothetical protein WCF25_01320 [Acidimicrobiales bacterium]